MIKLKNISYAYPGQPPLLQNISTTFADGKITSILGPNGCGKSTLLKIICRLLQPSQGTILLHGKDIHAMKTKTYAKEVTLLAQTNHPPVITVEDLVAYGRYPHQKYGQGLTKEDKEIIAQSIAQVKANEYAQRYVNRLSGGQRQRAYIAMALAQNTDIIFLDVAAIDLIFTDNYIFQTVVCTPFNVAIIGVIIAFLTSDATISDCANVLLIIFSTSLIAVSKSSLITV